uniref:K Homology domain-containing protein n=1 Tax=Romanomermis culicivorax TaxID=13658 RepID=A0A915K808_ROMCU
MTSPFEHPFLGQHRRTNSFLKEIFSNNSNGDGQQAAANSPTKLACCGDDGTIFPLGNLIENDYYGSAGGDRSDNDNQAGGDLASRQEEKIDMKVIAKPKRLSRLPSMDIDQIKPFVPRQELIQLSQAQVAALALNTSASIAQHSLGNRHQFSSGTFCTNNNSSAKYTKEYMFELLKEKQELNSIPKCFTHLERLIDEELLKVKNAIGLYSGSTNRKQIFPLILPRPEGEVVLLEEKVYIPVGTYPNYNFVGRILGPRGMTAKQLEQETGCKIMIRGKGSVRDRAKEDMCRGKPNWEHLDDELHILIQCEDAENRAKVKVHAAVEEVKKMLVPAPDGEDELKRKQLMELAIINGTYRPTNQKKIATQTPRLLNPMTLTASLRSSTVTDNPFALGASVNALLNGSCSDMESNFLNNNFYAQVN